MATVQTIYGQGSYGNQGYTTADVTTTTPGAPNTGFWAQPAVQDGVVGGSSVLIVAAIVLVVMTIVARRKRRTTTSFKTEL